MDEPQDSLARFARENSTLRSGLRKREARMIALENAIRKHAFGECECASRTECLTRLAHLVPVNPRKRVRR